MVVPTNTFQFEVKHHICTQWGNPLSKRNNPGQFLFFLKEEVYQALSIKFVFIQGQNNRLAHPPRGNPGSPDRSIPCMKTNLFVNLLIAKAELH